MSAAPHTGALLQGTARQDGLVAVWGGHLAATSGTLLCAVALCLLWWHWQVDVCAARCSLRCTPCRKKSGGKTKQKRAHIPLHSAPLLRPAETLRTEVPPLLREACKQLRLLSGAEVPVELSDDDLARLASGGYCTPGVAGCSATAALHSEREAAAAAQSSDWRAFGGEQRGMALLLTLCPPLAMAAANPDSFLGALQVREGGG